MHDAHAVNRQVELVAPFVGDNQKIIGDTLDGQFDKAAVLPDAVVVVHDQIVLFQFLQIEQLGRGLGFGEFAAVMPHPENFIIGDDSQAFLRPDESAGNLTGADIKPSLVIAGLRKFLYRRHLQTIGNQQGIEPGGLGLGPAHGKCREAGTAFRVQPLHQRLEQMLFFPGIFDFHAQIGVVFDRGPEPVGLNPAMVFGLQNFEHLERQRLSFRDE